MHTGEKSKAALSEPKTKEEERWGGAEMEGYWAGGKTKPKRWLVIYRKQAERGHD